MTRSRSVSARLALALLLAASSVALLPDASASPPSQPTGCHGGKYGASTLSATCDFIPGVTAWHIALDALSHTHHTGYVAPGATNCGSGGATLGNDDCQFSQATYPLHARMWATNADGDSIDSDDFIVRSAAQGQPTSCAQSAATGTTATISCDFSGASGYSIVVAQAFTSSDCTTGFVHQDVGFYNDITLTTLSASTTYHAWVQARATDGSGPISACVSVTTTSGIPAQPVCTAASTGTTSIHIVCDPEADVDVDAAIPNVHYDTASHADWADYPHIFGCNPFPTGTGADDCDATSLSPSTTYHFRVEVGSSYGYSAPSDDFTATTDTPVPPDTPTGCAGNVMSPDHIVMSCDAEPGVTSWSLRWDTSSHATFTDYPESDGCGSDVSWLPVGCQAFSLTGGTTYHFRAIATNANGDSTPTSDFTATTDPAFPPADAPTSCTATPDGALFLEAICDPAADADSYLLFWDTVSHASSDDYYGAVPCVPFPDCDPPGPLVAGTTYHFRMAAVNNYGQGPDSADFSGTAIDAPAAPANCAQTAATLTSVTLTCDSTPGADMYVFRNEQSVGDFNCEDVAEPTCEYTGLDPGTTYQFFAWASNIAGSGDNTADFDATTSPPPVPVDPMTLGECDATSPGDDDTVLVVTCSGVVNEEGWKDQSGAAYAIVYDPLSHETAEGYAFGSTVCPIADMEGSGCTGVGGMDPGTTYHFRAWAFNDFGDGPISNDFTGTTSGTPPAAPTGFAASPTASCITFTWTANTELSLAGYNVYEGSDLRAVVTTTTWTTCAPYEPTPRTWYLRAFDTSGNQGDAAQVTTRMLPRDSGTRSSGTASVQTATPAPAVASATPDDGASASGIRIAGYVASGVLLVLALTPRPLPILPRRARGLLRVPAARAVLLVGTLLLLLLSFAHFGP